MHKKEDAVGEPKSSTERVFLSGEKRMRVVYVGTRGGKYVKMDGKFVSLKSVKVATDGKRKQKGGLETLTSVDPDSVTKQNLQNVEKAVENIINPDILSKPNLVGPLKSGLDKISKHVEQLIQEYNKDKPGTIETTDAPFCVKNNVDIQALIADFIKTSTDLTDDEQTALLTFYSIPTSSSGGNPPGSGENKVTWVDVTFCIGDTILGSPVILIMLLAKGIQKGYNVLKNLTTKSSLPKSTASEVYDNKSICDVDKIHALITALDNTDIESKTWGEWKNFLAEQTDNTLEVLDIIIRECKILNNYRDSEKLSKEFIKDKLNIVINMNRPNATAATSGAGKRSANKSYSKRK